MENFENYIFKVCRVHNKKDLDSVIKNGANMIGIHAVILNRDEYIYNEKKYMPIVLKDDYDKELPIFSLEVESIKNMQRSITNDVIPVILFQREIDINKMVKCCEVYNLNRNNMYIQLHHRLTENYLNEIKQNVCKNIIAVIGAFQNDFEDYFKYLEKKLDKNRDFILIDLSVHQSNLANYNYRKNKLNIIKSISKIIENNKIPIILAEDTTLEKMKIYLDVISCYNVNLKGLDMQNSVEIDKKNQKYEWYKDKYGEYQIKVRKSEELLSNWKKFFETNNRYFV